METIGYIATGVFVFFVCVWAIANLAAYFVNLKFAPCELPSFSWIMSWRQVPAQDLLVFHT